MTTTWQIFDTKSQKADGLITQVTYGCTVQLENCIDRKIGEVELTRDTSVEGFIPYLELTPEVVIEWVKASLGEEVVASIQTSLQNNVAAQKAAKDSQTVQSGLPWRQ
jgi:hypothetical protein